MMSSWSGVLLTRRLALGIASVALFGSVASAVDGKLVVGLVLPLSGASADQGQLPQREIGDDRGEQ
jgi:hypothetical protein